MTSESKKGAGESVSGSGTAERWCGGGEGEVWSKGGRSVRGIERCEREKGRVRDEGGGQRRVICVEKGERENRRC